MQPTMAVALVVGHPLTEMLPSLGLSAEELRVVCFFVSHHTVPVAEVVGLARPLGVDLGMETTLVDFRHLECLFSK